MKYADANGRRRIILDRLRASGFLSIAEFARDLAISEMTVRRDLRLLRDEAPITLVHGGASMAPAAAGLDYVARTTVAVQAKTRIAREAIGFIGETDTLALDAGTTMLELARHLPQAFRGCVVTPSLPVLDLLAGRAETRVIALAGELHRPSLAFAGSLTVAAVRELRLSTFFLGAAAVDARGVYVAADIERASKLALMDAADRVVLVADRTKFEASAPVRLCDFDGIDALVTDRSPPTVIAEQFVKRSVHVAREDGRA